MNGTRAKSTAGFVQQDGTVAEIIRTPTGQLHVLTNGSVPRSASELEIKGALYRPTRIFRGEGRAIVLPSGCAADVPKAHQLLQKITAILETHVSAAGDAMRLTAFFALGSWFADCVDPAPALAVVGPRPEALDVLRLLQQLSYRGFLLNDPRRSTLCHVPANLHPTVLIANARKIVGDLAQVQNAGLTQIINGRLCSSRIAMAVHSVDAPTDFDAIRVAVLPAEGCLTIHQELLTMVSDEIQPQLLSYRLEHVKNLPTLRQQCSDCLRPFARGLANAALPLMLALDEAELRLELCELLARQNEDLLAGRAASPKAVLLDALLACCHQQPLIPKVYVRDVAFLVNEILHRRGEAESLTDRRVGALLKELGLATGRLDGGGRGLRLTEAVRGEIHALGRRLGIRSTETPLSECLNCTDQAQPLDSDGGVNV